MRVGFDDILTVRYDFSDDEELSMLVVFCKRENEIKKVFAGEKAKKLYCCLTRKVDF